MLKRNTAVVVLLVAAFAAVTAWAHSSAPADEIAAADIAFCKATQERGLEGWVEWFSDKAALTQFDPPAIGKDGVRRAYTGLFALPKLDFKWTPSKSEVLPQGDLGYSTGRYTLSFADPKGNVRTRTGNYITVWQKQKDGSWKVVGDYGAQDAPLSK